MNKTITQLSLLAMLVAGTSVVGYAHADTLLIDRANSKEAAVVPARGQTMGEIEARYGEPAERLDPRGGQKSQWPAIHRWVYPQFTVYFEKDRVIDVVVNRAHPGEIGPKPPLL